MTLHKSCPFQFLSLFSPLNKSNGSKKWPSFLKYENWFNCISSSQSLNKSRIHSKCLISNKLHCFESLNEVLTSYEDYHSVIRNHVSNLSFLVDSLFDANWLKRRKTNTNQMDSNSFAIVNVLKLTQIRQVWLEFLFDCQSIVWTQISYDVRHLNGQQRSIIAANMITILSRNAHRVLIYCKVEWLLFDIMNLYQYVDTIAIGISENRKMHQSERKSGRENPFEFFFSVAVIRVESEKSF